VYLFTVDVYVCNKYIYVSIWLEEREYRQEIRLVYFMDNGC